MSLGENSLVAAYQGRGQLKSRPSRTRVVTMPVHGVVLHFRQDRERLEMERVVWRIYNATAIHPKIATQSLFNSISAIYWRRLGPGFFGGRMNIRGTGRKNVFTPVHFRLILIKCVDFE